MREHLLFLRHYVRHPVTVSSVIPTSKHTLRMIAEKIDGSQRRVIMEYGPGTGGLARMLLKNDKLTPDSKLILIEATKGFADYLQATINDPRVQVVHGSAEHADRILAEAGEQKADYILCSAPLTLFPYALTNMILKKTYNLLADDGAFIVYLFRRRIKTSLKTVFPQVHSRTALWNIPPLVVCTATKQ